MPDAGPVPCITLRGAGRHLPAVLAGIAARCSILSTAYVPPERVSGPLENKTLPVNLESLLCCQERCFYY